MHAFTRTAATLPLLLCALSATAQESPEPASAPTPQATSQATPRATLVFGGDEPIHVEAVSATYRGEITVLEGEVYIRQGEAEVWADRVDIYRDAATPTNTSDGVLGGLSFGAVERMVATGAFKYATPENTVTGSRGEYIAARDLFVVTGNVAATQPSGSRMEGSRVTLDLVTGAVSFGEDCRASNSCERVSFSFE